MCALLLFSCSEDLYDEGGDSGQKNSGLINRSGQIDGVKYSLSNVSVNSDVIVVNSQNAELVSTADELSAGNVKINSQLSFTEGDLVYIRIGDYTALKRVVTVKSGNGISELQTEQAQLGELFESGDINLSVDFYEVNKLRNNNSQVRSSGFDKIYEVINIDDEYDWGNSLKYSPSTNVKMALYMNMAFNRSQLLPSEFTTYFEIQPAVNPYLSFAGSVNHAYTDDLIRFVPSELIDWLKQQEFDIEIPINVLGIETLPAKIKIADINIPTTIEANLSKESNLTFGVNGSFKVGYSLDINRLNVKVNPIYENNIVAEAPSDINLNGELLTNSEIVITPNISFLNDLYKISGDIVFGVKTETNGSASIPGDASFASKGLFTSRMTVLVDLLITKVPIDIFNNEQELWNVGSFEKQVVYSDLSWKVTSKYSANLLLLSRMYETDFSVKYKYPVLGKKVPNELLITYEVYQENGSSRIVKETDLVVIPANVTNDSFTFKLNIPYRSKLLSYQTKSYLKNIVIKDRNGYVYEGIFNTTKNVNENSFEIKR